MLFFSCTGYFISIICFIVQKNLNRCSFEIVNILHILLVYTWILFYKILLESIITVYFSSDTELKATSEESQYKSIK